MLQTGRILQCTLSLKTLSRVAQKNLSAAPIRRPIHHNTPSMTPVVATGMPKQRGIRGKSERPVDKRQSSQAAGLSSQVVYQLASHFKQNTFSCVSHSQKIFNLQQGVATFENIQALKVNICSNQDICSVRSPSISRNALSSGKPVTSVQYNKTKPGFCQSAVNALNWPLPYTRRHTQARRGDNADSQKGQLFILLRRHRSLHSQHSLTGCPRRKAQAHRPTFLSATHAKTARTSFFVRHTHTCTPFENTLGLKKKKEKDLVIKASAKWAQKTTVTCN